MTDRVVLHDMRFMGRHGVHEREQLEAQPFAVDVELMANLQPAGVDDDLSKTVDYGAVFEVCRQVVESTSFRLIEALAEALAHEILAEFSVIEVGIRVRKLQPPIDGTLGYAGVEIWRRRSGSDRR
ncbi:MAG TPA: dihydroneopterin aldolase [Candidatus Acidoferrum sp.]|nr:dihydroneopterin aldolase [Candidatus Acidoferrum sp.]